MALVNQPAILSGAFAAEGDKNTIPANNDGLSGLASIAKGFPPITQVPLAQGGQPPQRQDFNGIFNLFSQFLLYAQNGGVYAYNNTLDYQPPCIISYDGEFYSCLQENGPSTSAGVQPVTNTTYWEKLIPDVAVMKGATVSVAGASGLVPTPAAGENDEFLRGDGTWQPINIMKGASASASGAAGLVPAPAQNQQKNFLTGAGTWQAIATTTQAQAGTDDSAPMTALKVKQAITAQVSTVPTGTILPFAGNSIPSGFLACNGAEVSRTTYAALYSAIGTRYGSGNGSSTFNLPNVESNKFLQGNSTPGTVKTAGLPNITGVAYAAADYGFFRKDSNGNRSGAFIKGAAANNLEGGGYSNISTNYLGFDASAANSIYGASNTVQPPAVTVRFIIKY